jgi:hypothetical protein
LLKFLNKHPFGAGTVYKTVFVFADVCCQITAVPGNKFFVSGFVVEPKFGDYIVGVVGYQALGR